MTSVSVATSAGSYAGFGIPLTEKVSWYPSGKESDRKELTCIRYITSSTTSDAQRGFFLLSCSDAQGVLGTPYGSGHSPISSQGPAVTREQHVPGIDRSWSYCKRRSENWMHKCCGEREQNWWDFRAFPTLCSCEALFELSRENAMETLPPSKETVF